jgi:hypothetical protein
MGFLRRLFGGEASPVPSEAPAEPPATRQELDEDERAYERDLALFEQQRLDDLRHRQLRYADRSWTPPAQGGTARSDDADPGGGDAGA